MATDYEGNIITSEQIKGMERFNDDNSPHLETSQHFDISIDFEIDDAWCKEHDKEDARVYWLMLPPKINNKHFDIREGDVFQFTKQCQYDGRNYAWPKRVRKKFRVTKVDKEISHNAVEFCLHITASVVPID